MAPRGVPVRALPPVLVVDSNPDDRRLAAVMLAHEFGPVEVIEAGEAASFTAALRGRRFGIALVEPRLPWLAPRDVLDLVAEARPDACLVVVTSDLDEELAALAVARGADALVVKSSAGFLRLPSAVRGALFRARRRQAAAQRDAPYRKLVEGLPVGVFIASSEGRILEANPALATILGYSGPDELSRRSLEGLFLHQRDADTWRSTLESSGAIAGFDVAVRRADGGSAWARVAAWIVEDSASGVRQLHGTVEETGGYHAAQEELAKRSAALARSNADLERFAYVVSHDLQQPLGVISRSLDLVPAGDGDPLGPDGARCLDNARRAADTLQRMIDAVLGYSRIDTRGGAFAPVELDRVFDRVVSLLEAEIEAAGAEVTREQLPVVHGDEAQLVQLLQNLIGNALKFRAERRPVIRVSARAAADQWLIEVRDNGIGVPAEAAERIFEMFQRLHTEAEVPGTGIGLAVCRRIADRHGGRIWVQSTPGDGAAFRVALPRSGPPDPVEGGA